LIFDKARNKWRFLQWVDGRRKSRIIGTREEFPTERAAWREIERLNLAPQKPKPEITVKVLAERFQHERFPQRRDTARVYRSFLNCHVLPQWGDHPLSAIQPQAVEMWLRGLPLAPKSRTHVRSLLHGLMEFAMFAGVIELGRNPISLVRNVGATQKVRPARNLTVEQFHALLKELREPFGTMALLCACLGLRISECLGLMWRDVDWLGSRLSIERSMVEQHIDEVKTKESRKQISLSEDVLVHLRVWKQSTQFGAEDDFVFASPLKLGRQPYSYTGFWRELQAAAATAQVGKLGTHAFRHISELG
jgi:integrase